MDTFEKIRLNRILLSPSVLKDIQYIKRKQKELGCWEKSCANKKDHLRSFEKMQREGKLDLEHIQKDIENLLIYASEYSNLRTDGNFLISRLVNDNQVLLRNDLFKIFVKKMSS